MKNPAADIHVTRPGSLEDQEWHDAGSANPWSLRSVAAAALGLAAFIALVIGAVVAFPQLAGG